MKSSALVIAMLVSFNVVHAQVGVPLQEKPRELQKEVFGLGVAAGYVGGIGLSFRHHLASSFSYQITGGIIKSDDRLHYDFGTEAQVDLARSESTRFYACGGLGYFFSGKSGENELEGPMRLGAGIGVESSRAASFGFSLDLMFSYFSDGTVLPLPQLGAHYYFY